MAEVQIGNITVDGEGGVSNNTVTFEHTVDEGTDVMLAIICLADSGRTIDVFTWDSVAMDQVLLFDPELTGTRDMAVYQVIAPTGTHDVTFTMGGGNCRFGITVINFTGINQQIPIDLSTIQTTTQPNGNGIQTTKKTKAPFVFSVCQQGITSGGCFTQFDAIPLDGSGGIADMNFGYASSSMGCSMKAGTLGKDVNTHMGWLNNFAHTFGLITFAMNAGEEEIEFIGGPLGLTDHLQVPGRNRSM